MFKRFHPGPKRRPENGTPGSSVQVYVKQVKLQSGRLYQFTAIDEATRYRLLKIYDHNSMLSAGDFIDELRKRFPWAIDRVQIDRGTEFGSHFTWHLEYPGIKHKHNLAACPEVNGKVQRSHRTDEDKSYRRFTFGAAAELRAALRDWEREYHQHRLHMALKGKISTECLLELRGRPHGSVGLSA
jgi:transposase InsO family protein